MVICDNPDCDNELTEEEIEDSKEIIGGERRYCETHLNKKMDW